MWKDLPYITYWTVPSDVGAPLVIRALIRHRGADHQVDFSTPGRTSSAGWVTGAARRLGAVLHHLSGARISQLRVEDFPKKLAEREWFAHSEVTRVRKRSLPRLKEKTVSNHARRTGVEVCRQELRRVRKGSVSSWPRATKAGLFRFGRRASCHYEGPNDVVVAGTFNGWNPKATPMRRGAKDEWSVELGLILSIYEYKFVIDGEWCCDPSHTGESHGEDCAPNSMGTMNRALGVG